MSHTALIERKSNTRPLTYVAVAGIVIVLGAAIALTFVGINSQQVAGPISSANIERA